MLLHAEVHSCFLSAFQFTLAVSLKSLVLALTGPYFFFPLWKQRKTLGHYMVCKCSFETRAGRRGLLSATRDRNEPRKKAGWRGWARNEVEEGKKGRQEELEQHRCIMCACWHTKDAVFTAGAAASRGNVPRSRLWGKMCHIYLSCSPSKEKWGTTNVPCHISGCVPLTGITRKHGQHTSIEIVKII